MKSVFLVIFLSFVLSLQLSFGSADTKTLILEKDSYVSSIDTLINLINIKNSEISDGLDNLKKKDDIIRLMDEKLKAKDEFIKNIVLDECPIGQRGIYTVRINTTNNFEAACDEDGWMTIQRRSDGSVNFTRDWKDYKNGFGDVSNEFFIGLDKLHHLTKQRPYELNITLGDVSGNTSYAYYDDFKIGSEAESYWLVTLGKYNGTAGDSLLWNRLKKFSTFDRDNDLVDRNCAQTHSGGWWFAECGYSSLNGKYYKDGRVLEDGWNGIQWGTAHGYNYKISLTSTEMKIRPKVF